jgi:hypothetical protein
VEENGRDHTVGQLVLAPVCSAWIAAKEAVGSTLSSWWGNPLFRHVRHEEPLPWQMVRRWFGPSMIVWTSLTILAWLANWRSLGALLIGISLGGVLLPGLVAPGLGADRVARQMRFPRQDSRRITNLEPLTVVWGLALTILWRLRWLIIIGLVMTPALILGMLRLDIASFIAWRDSAQALGASTPAVVSGLLPPDGHIPYFRLIVRALSAGILPWVVLPLLVSGGITSALFFRDASLSPLVGLLGGLLVYGLALFAWDRLTWTPLLAGGLEIVRVVLLTGVMVGIGVVAAWVKQKNGGLLR